MAKLVLDDLASLQNETSAIATINNNNLSVETAMEKTLSRDGESPNSMQADLDMNSQRIINLPAPSSNSEPLRLGDTFTTVPGTLGGSVGLNDNRLLRSDGTGGFTVQGSGVTLDDSSNISGIAALNATNVELSGGLIVGFDGTPVADRIQVGNAVYYLDMTDVDPVIVFDTGDQYRYDRVNNQWVWAVGASSTLVLAATNLRPAANDGMAIGTNTLAFSDLFLAEGGVINFDNGDVTVAQSGNSLTVAGGNLIFPGTATNDSASAGQVGEIIESTVLVGAAVALTTGVTVNVTSISLTAGDWDVWGNVWFNAAATTNVTRSHAAITTTSATLPTAPGNGAYNETRQGAHVPAGAYSVSAGQRRISLASTTSVFLVANSTFTISTNAAYGYIGARRVR